MAAVVSWLVACGGTSSSGTTGSSNCDPTGGSGGSGTGGAAPSTSGSGANDVPSVTINFPGLVVPAGTEQQGLVSAYVQNPEALWVREIEWSSTHVIHHGRLDAPPTPATQFFPIYGLPVGAKAGVETLRDGYAVVLAPNQELRIAYHFVNTTPTDYVAEVQVTLRMAPPDAPPPIPASLFALLNEKFTIAPQSNFEVETTCPLPFDVTVLSLMPHQHGLGKGIDAWIVGGPNDGKLVYTTDTWEDAPITHFDPPLELKAGEQLRWVCRWQNPKSDPVPAGQLADQEMCSIAGLYAPSVGPIGGGPLVEGGPCLTQVLNF